MTPLCPPAADVSPALLQMHARGLGTSSAGATRLLALLYEPDVTVGRVLGALSNEPALAARVLKVANSPYYRLCGQVGTLQRAVDLLGLTAIRGIAAAGCLDRMAPPRAGRAFDPERFRRHSLAVASAAQQLSQAAGLPAQAEAFMAGLLHDIGVLVLAKAVPVALNAFEPQAFDTAEQALAHEQSCLGTTHVACAAVLADDWQWPAWLRDAVVGHHQPDRPTRGQAPLPAVLALADRLAEQAGLGFWPTSPADDTAALALSLGLDEAGIDAVRRHLPDSVAALSGSNVH